MEIFYELLVLCKSYFYLFKLIRICFELLLKNGFYILIILLHYILIVELLLDMVDSLHICIHYFCFFGTVTKRYVVTPVYLVEFQVEIQNVQRMQHVYEGKSYRALSLQVHR